MPGPITAASGPGCATIAGTAAAGVIRALSPAWAGRPVGPFMEDAI